MEHFFPTGGSEITFSLGANDRQVLQPPLSKTIPLTSTVVFDLFDQLGICAAVNVVLALMTENKVLILSRSFTQIYNASQAMIALMYPFVYSHVYIPILPIDMLDFVSSPTPFLMGTHSSVKNQTQDIVRLLVLFVRLSLSLLTPVLLLNVRLTSFSSTWTKAR